MSLLATRVGMPHLCTIQRDGATADEWGGGGNPSWANLATNVNCRAFELTGREPVDADRTIVVRDQRVLVPLGTDVTEKDRITNVTERGAVIFAGPLMVEAVVRRPDHLELMVQEIR